MPTTLVLTFSPKCTALTGHRTQGRRGKKDFAVTKKSLEIFYPFQEPLRDTTCKIIPRLLIFYQGVWQKLWATGKELIYAMQNKSPSGNQCLSNKSCQSNIRKFMHALLCVWVPACVHTCTKRTYSYREAVDNLLLIQHKVPFFCFENSYQSKYLSFILQ